MNYPRAKRNRLRRLAAAALGCALLLAAGGCASVFNREYVSVSDHVDEYLEPETMSRTAEVRNYAQMRNTVLSMVEAGAESFMFTTQDYTGSAKEDISRACLEVTRETPIGAYAVEYMTHYCTQILTYYRIEVFVTYKHTPEEIAAVRRVSGERELLEAVVEDVVEYRPYAAYSFVGVDADENLIRDAVTKSYRTSPVRLTDMPAISCSVYPNDGSVQKIIEIKYDYSAPLEILSLRRAAILSSAGAMLYDCPSEATALDVFEAMSESCRYVPDGGSSVHDAIVLGEAGPEGIAMAFKLLCDLTNVECLVVEGKRDGEPYFWNIVRIGDALYHSDVAECLASGPERAFMLRDADMWGRYLWDTAEYPPCEGELTYEDLFEDLEAEPPAPPEEEPND